MATARAYGVSKIIAIDISQKRIDFAKSMWADYGFMSPRKEADQDYSDWADAFKTQVMKDAGLDSWGVDIAVEASGAEPCMHAGIAFTHAGGTCKYLTVFPPRFWVYFIFHSRCSGRSRACY